jgi:hypothetical protein
VPVVRRLPGTALRADGTQAKGVKRDDRAPGTGRVGGARSGGRSGGRSRREAGRGVARGVGRIARRCAGPGTGRRVSRRAVGVAPAAPGDTP